MQTKKKKNCLLAAVFSLLYFLHTLCHADHFNEKDTSPLLKCFEVLVLCCCVSSCWLIWEPNFWQSWSEMCPVFPHSFSSFIIVASLSGVLSSAELKHSAGLSMSWPWWCPASTRWGVGVNRPTILPHHGCCSITQMLFLLVMTSLAYCRKKQKKIFRPVSFPPIRVFHTIN